MLQQYNWYGIMILYILHELQNQYDIWYFYKVLYS